MISTLLVDYDKTATAKLENLLIENCPQISVHGISHSFSDARGMISDINPDLVFLEVELPSCNGLEMFDPDNPVSFEIIALSDKVKHTLKAFKCNASGYLLKPIQKDILLKTVQNVKRRIFEKKRHLLDKTSPTININNNYHEEVIGIPTIEGFEFIKISNIIRCQGMQKCTRVITTEKTDIISSYNLGQFRKKLEPFGFYSPHKSHLINLNLIRKYHKEGNILMTNGSWVPVATRKKKDFVDRITRI